MEGGQAFLGCLGRELEALKEGLLTVDLATNQLQGIALQNQARGVSRVLDILSEIATYEETAS